MAEKTGTTIIIKKIKKGGHGHHGGAWKVAYADFVTAMMSFFLLLWLLTATPVENLKGLADYFSPTLGMQGKLGIGFAGGRSPDSEGRSQGNWASQGLIFGAPPSGPIIKFPDKDNHTEQDNQTVEFGKLKEDVTKNLSDEKSNEFQDSVLIEQTPEGLKINIVDTEGRPMFKEGGAELEDAAKRILAKIAGLVKDIPNYIQIAGSTNSVSYSNDENFSNWELSAARANAARRYLIKAGIESSQIARILALADQEPLDGEHPEAEKNSRVTITLLRKTILAYNRQPAPEEVIMGPIEAGLKTYAQIKKKEAEDEPPAPPVDPNAAPPEEVVQPKHYDDSDVSTTGKKKHGSGEKKKDKDKDKDKQKTDSTQKKKKKKSSSSGGGKH